jgi:parallel beta-helix repeat protein
MLIVRLANFTDRLHLVNNILVNDGERQLYTAGIMTTIQTTYGQRGTDFLVANNTVTGIFDHAGIWLQSLNRARLVHNQVSNVPAHGIRISAVDMVTIQGNIVINCTRGLLIEDSLNLQVIGNAVRGSGVEGILLTTSDTGQRLSGQFLGNQVSGNGGAGIIEQGPGVFDTHYLFNDLRDNIAGPFQGNIDLNARATRVGNLATPEYIRGHSSATSAWDPPLLAHGSTVSTDILVNGAQVGDTVAVGFTQPLPSGAILAGAVTAANTVTVTLLNMTGSSFDLPSGTVRADVWRH